MIPTLNEVLFVLTTLFGLNTVFVAEQTHLTLDFNHNTGRIEYFDLRTPNQATEHVKLGLDQISNSNEFNKSFTQLKLNSKSFEKKDGKLNVYLDFSFSDQNDLMKLLRFNTTNSGEETSSDAIYYCLLPSEELISSNADKKKIEGPIELKWDKKTMYIELQLEQKDNSNGPMMKSISEYWEE